MDIEELKKNYGKFNYHEKLEDMQEKAKWDSKELKNIVNWQEAYDYVMELADEWETRAKIYLSDIELQDMHRYIKDIVEYIEILRNDYFNESGVSKSFFARILDDIVMLINRRCQMI